MRNATRLVLTLVALAWASLAAAQTETLTVTKAVITGTNPSITLTSTSQAAVSLYNEAGLEQWLVALNGGAANDNLIVYDRQGTRTLMEFLTSANQVNVLALGSPAANNLTIVPDGDLILNPTGNDVLPTGNYDINLGGLTKKWLSLHAAELWVETLVAQETQASVGGRILVAPTTTLTRDLAAGDTTMYVKHAMFSYNTFVILQVGGVFEAIKITGSPTEISATEYSYAVTRNQDGTGANQWYAGDAVVGTGRYDAAIPAAAQGFIDIYSVQSVKAWDSFAARTLNKVPYFYWRFGDSAYLGGIGGADADGSIPDFAGVISAASSVLVAQDTTLGSSAGSGTWLSDGQGGAFQNANPPNGGDYYKTASTAGSYMSSSVTVLFGTYIDNWPSAGNACVLVMKGGTADKSVEFGVGVNDSQQLLWYQGNGTNLSTVSLGASITDQVWTMVAVTRLGDGTSGSSIQLTTCPLGSSCSTATATSATYAPGTGSNEIAVFADDADASATRCQYYTHIDELMVFDRRLTATEISDIFAWRTAKSASYQTGPTIVGNRRTGGTNWNDFREWWAIGNLDGLYDYSRPTAGAAFGDPTDTHLTIDTVNGIRMREGGYTRAQWATNGDLTIGVPSGTSGNIYIANTGTLYARSGTTAGVTIDSTGVLVGVEDTDKSNVKIASGAVKLRTNTTDKITLDTSGNVLVGQTGASQSNVYITSGAVKLRTDTTDKIVLDTSGNVTISGSLSVQSALTVSTSGSVASGASGWNNGTGFWMDYNGGSPRFFVGSSSGNKLLWDPSSGGHIYVKDGNVEISSGVLYLRSLDTTTSDDYPVVYSTSNERLYRKTDGVSGSFDIKTTSDATYGCPGSLTFSATFERGILVSMQCL